MNRNVVVLTAVAGLAFAAGRLQQSGAWAQQGTEMDPEMKAYVEAGTPGKHHRHMDALAGDWHGHFRIRMGPDSEPFESKGTISREWVLGGRFLHETVRAQSDHGDFKGVAYLGYNNQDGRYEFVWMENMSTAMYTETGTYNPRAKVLTTRGSHRDPVTGRLIMTRGELDMSDPDRHVFTGWATGPDGREYKSMEGWAVRE